jgi:hypothetical protein
MFIPFLKNPIVSSGAITRDIRLDLRTRPCSSDISFPPFILIAYYLLAGYLLRIKRAGQAHGVFSLHDRLVAGG